MSQEDEYEEEEEAAVAEDSIVQLALKFNIIFCEESLILQAEQYISGLGNLFINAYLHSGLLALTMDLAIISGDEQSICDDWVTCTFWKQEEVDCNADNKAFVYKLDIPDIEFCGGIVPLRKLLSVLDNSGLEEVPLDEPLNEPLDEPLDEPPADTSSEVLPLELLTSLI